MRTSLIEAFGNAGEDPELHLTEGVGRTLRVPEPEGDPVISRHPELHEVLGIA